MNSPREDREKKLEQALHRTLRALPERRAPRTLENRVMAELARRAALPWWQKSFKHWPVAAQGGFFLVVAGVVKVLLIVSGFFQSTVASGEITQALAPQVGAVERTVGVARWIGDFASSMVNAIPPVYLYGGIAVVVGLYVTLFGLGAAAYRTLYANANR